VLGSRGLFASRPPRERYLSSVGCVCNQRDITIGSFDYKGNGARMDSRLAAQSAFAGIVWRTTITPADQHKLTGLLRF